jgi:hypothetical protein
MQEDGSRFGEVGMVVQYLQLLGQDAHGSHGLYEEVFCFVHCIACSSVIS